MNPKEVARSIFDQLPNGFFLGKLQGSFPLHVAAKEGYLHKMPASAITLSTLLSKDSGGCTVFQRAASSGCLDAIPQKFLTGSVLLDVTPNGNNCIHLAASTKSLNHIPKELLSAENLLVVDAANQSVLEIAASTGCLEQLLGTELPDECRAIVGDEWWAMNEDVCRISRPAVAESEVEIF